MQTKTLVMISLFTALTIIASFIRFNLGPIPFSLQIVVVFIVSALFSLKVAASSQALYILMGLIGLPVFSQGGGIFYVIKPTFGFLVGFLIASIVMNLCIQKLRRTTFLNLLGVHILGTIVIYIFGCVHFYVIMNVVVQQAVSLQDVITGIVLLSMPGDIILCILTTFIIQKLKNTHRRGQFA
ncbi:biotin transporter BioY [Staphylococcus massiliensis]|uniref:Biotin transporter n=1 Tax=Staphylococcus massiliensis S46 TaxID=1229783 RepID=K9ALI1_9STAP|nr:biotin transporter BioY [Staphylococcus massiliensis]EKU48233.1 putative biotin synthase [Staphylococcus massiliensis S46]MCG3399506.1 biotin transporter BioY [Staphylococcus massiliensis]MCG3402015.1 biotin transporter BioY [Staphylococcus massiliensis]POA00115.1 biotin transporter BioY [Staphylococcus massiliensis CCUG 55927]